MAEQTFVVPLTSLRRGDIRVAGGKGANLGEIIHAGAPEPAGFVLTCAAYNAHMHHSGLAGQVTDLLAAAPDGSRLREAIRAADPPESVRSQLIEAYTQLVGDPVRGAVAVRSSAAAEDLPTAAMAGQHETVLNVVGVPALIDAVRECWASLWTERAIDYRQRRGITNEGIAVVVQRMVPAEVAGVMFTADPVTGARNEIVVEATAGLGDAVVAGRVTPHRVVWDKRAGRIRSSRPGTPLTREDLRRLAGLGRRLERHFGTPQDIEWAWYRGRPYLLQTRPITALPPPPPRQTYERVFASLVAEVLPIRPFPLDVTTWLGSVLSTAESVARDLGFGPRVLGELVVDDGVVVVQMRPPALRPTWRLLLLPARIWRWRRHPRVDEAAAWEAMVEPVRALYERDLADASWRELVQTLRAASVVPPRVIAYRLRGLSDAVAVLWLIGLLWSVRRLDLLGDLLSGTDNMTAETSRALDALAARIRTDPALASLFANHPPAALTSLLAEQHPGFLADFHRFLDQYGHRETTSPLLATQPTWRDAPQVVLGLLKVRSAAPPTPPPRPAWRVAREELLGHWLLRSTPARHLADRWLTRARRAFRARENGRFYLTLALPVVYGTIRELGHRLSKAGVLERPGDVFHLTLEELEQVPAWPPPAAIVAELRARVTRRAAIRAALADTPLLDPAYFSPAQRRETGAKDALLQGVPGSPGTATGPARIIRGAADFHRLQPGDVLVTPYTNPAWTPLFPRAAAVVVDTGGVMSHAAIVAREYRIPAVMATGEGTHRLTDGQQVRVDGTHGVVEPA